MGSDVTIRVGDGTSFQAYLAGEAAPPRPAIIMFPPIFGADADARAIADRWAERGYLIAVPDYFFRTVPGVVDRSENGRKVAMERWKTLDVNRCIADMQSLKDHLLAMPNCNGELAALGFCAGGELAFLAATRLGAKAVATFHATHIDRHLDEAGKIAGAITMHFGGNDPLVPLDKVELIRSKLSSDARVEVRVYPGAGHGFSFQGQPAYNETAATVSDRRAQEVLASLKHERG
jgi:carboxymethylenebutenolidase